MSTTGRTTSECSDSSILKWRGHEALCILTGTTPIILKFEEVVKQYTFRNKQQQQAINLDYEIEYRL